MGEFREAFHGNRLEHCWYVSFCYYYYLSICLLFRILTMLCKALHDLPPAASLSDQQPHWPPCYPWTVPALSLGAFLCRTSLSLHLGLGSNVTSSTVHHVHLISTHPVYPMEPPALIPTLIFISLSCFVFFLIALLSCHYCL